jgi:hypothetical protein
MTRVVPKEADIQRAIIEWLEWKRIFHYRNNSGAFVFPETATSKAGFSKQARAERRTSCASLPASTSASRSSGQGTRNRQRNASFRSSLKRAGGRYMLAYSVDDVERGL